MAYGYTVTVTQHSSRVPNEDENGPIYKLTITETEAGTSSEAEVVLGDHGLPLVGRIIHRATSLQSGTGTTVSPVSGELTNPAAASVYRYQYGGTAAALVTEQASSPPVYVSGSSLFHRSGVDAGSDNTIVAVYTIVPGVGLA